MAIKEAFLTDITNNGSDTLCSTYSDGSTIVSHLNIDNIECLTSHAISQGREYGHYVLNKANKYTNVIGFIGANMLFASMINDINLGNIQNVFLKSAGAFAFSLVANVAGGLYARHEAKERTNHLARQLSNATCVLRKR